MKFCVCGEGKQVGRVGWKEWGSSVALSRGVGWEGRGMFCVFDGGGEWTGKSRGRPALAHQTKWLQLFCAASISFEVLDPLTWSDSCPHGGLSCLLFYCSGL